MVMTSEATPSRGSKPTRESDQKHDLIILMGQILLTQIGKMFYLSSTQTLSLSIFIFLAQTHFKNMQRALRSFSEQSDCVRRRSLKYFVLLFSWVCSSLFPWGCICKQEWHWIILTLNVSYLSKVVLMVLFCTLGTFTISISMNYR